MMNEVKIERMLDVSWHLEQHRNGFLTTWASGTLEEVLAELEAMRKEVKDFQENQMKVVRVERYLESPNATAHVREFSAAEGT